ncbi:MAG: 6,7-dimethyl-8-ribityllumazine synthase [Candidatus Aenigmatarchaeota archaeon]
MKIGIVVAEFYKELTDKMLESAQHKAKELGVDIIDIKRVFGSYDSPLIVKSLLEKDIDGVVVLGIIIQGGTDHDKLIAQTTASYLTKLSLKYNKPVTLGIMGPNITRKQAEERIDKYASNAIKAVVKSIEALS